MTRLLHRRPAAALFGAVAVLALTACSGQEYPNSTFTHLSDFNTDINNLWDRLYFLAMVVFVFVEALLLFTIFRFRAKPNAPLPKQIHGSHLLEMVWTAIPVLILIPLAIPTVKTIFKTQADAPAGSLQVEVYGHQWWWEFRYPQYGVTTANELYLPAGRTVNFTLRTQDVIHSFWTPQLAGKRDLISNKTNHIWYTPDAKLVEDAFNGFCTEYCGASHANMRFRVYTTSAENFEKWAAHQKNPATGSPAATAAQAAADSAAKKAPKAAAVVALPAAAPATADEGYVFPKDKLKPHIVPRTPVPASITFDNGLLAQGDAKAGRELVANPANMAKAPCLTCHVIRGEMAMVSDDQAKGPNLTHVASRHTFAAGLFPTSPENLARWIKNAQVMKPGATMSTFGLGEYSPMLKAKVTTGLSDKEIADIVAYLTTLK
jgi:cytochrome c oxidase subunit 2